MLEFRQRKDKKNRQHKLGALEMKKICYVVSIPLTIRAFFIPQLKYLSRNGFDVTVVCSPDDALAKDLGEEIRYYPIEIPRGISMKGSVDAISSLMRFFKKEKFDIVQYSTPNAALYASIAARVAGIKVRNYHLMGFRYLGAKGIGREILKVIEIITCANSTSIECVSKSNLKLGIKEKIFPHKKATVVWNGSTGGVDLNRFDFYMREEWRKQIRKENGYQASDFVYGFVGRVTRDKGINELLAAFMRLGNGSKLFVIGDMENKDTLNQDLLNKAMKNPNIKFHESVSDIERYYAALDVLVLPSYREGFGNVVIEAAAVGTPAVISNIPGPIDAIEEGKTAVVVETKSVKSLWNGMKEMYKADNEKMSKKAFELARQKFDSDKLNVEILKRKSKLVQI